MTPTSPLPTTAGFSRARLIPAAILAIFVYGLIAAVLGTLQPALQQRFTPDQNGTIAFMQGLGLAIASLLIGPIIDNAGKKTGLVAGFTLVTAAMFAIANLGSYAFVIALFLVLGLGGGMIVTGANALVSDISEARRGTVLNLLNLFFGLGGFATPLVGSFIGTTGLCYFVASLAAATLLLNIATKMPPPSGERGFRFSAAGQLIANPSLFLLSLFLFLYVSCEVGVWNWLAAELVAQGVPNDTALRIVSVGFALGLLVGRVAVAPVLIRVPAVTVTLFAAIFMAGTTYSMLQTTNSVAAGAAVFCAGLAMAPVFPTTLAIVGDAFPKATATAMGVAITSGWIGLMVSSKIIGAIAGKDPTRLRTALLVIPIFSVLMIGVNLLLRPMVRNQSAVVT
jgi:fucose permease